MSEPSLANGAVASRLWVTSEIVIFAYAVFDMSPDVWMVRFYQDARGREPDEGLIEQAKGAIVTTWRELKEARPLRGAAREAYEAERDAMGVGYVILKARASAGLTQDQLARRIGTSQSTIARWESGSQVPSVRSLLKIADATGFELAVGMREPGASEKSFEVLETLSSKRPANKPSAQPAIG